MNHKHDVNQVLLKFGLLLTSLVGMAPLSKTILILSPSVTFLFPFTPVTVVGVVVVFFFSQKLTNNYKHKLLSSRRGLIG